MALLRDDDLRDEAGAAHYIGVSVEEFRKMLAAGELPSPVWNPNALEEYLRERRELKHGS